MSRANFVCGIVSALVLLSACGQNYSLEFDTVTAARGIDDRVTISANVMCVQVGVACEAPCIEAAWYPPSALTTEPVETTATELRFDGYAEFDGEPARTLSTCASSAPADGETTTLAITTDEPVPEEDMLIKISITNSLAGGPEDLERVLIQP